MKAKIQNAAFYSLAALTCLVLLYSFKNVQGDALKILLYPHAKAAGVFYNISLVYITGIGYSSMDGAFTIGRECMGYNFIVMMFAMNACMFAKHFIGFHKVLWFLASLGIAVAAGVLISSIRIIGSIPLVTHEQFVLLHSGIGISLYFAALAGSYITIKNLIGSGKHERNR